MHLHEYQAKDLFKKAGIAICEGFVIDSVASLEAELATRKWRDSVLKAQIHSGARGKAGAVRIVPSVKEAVETAKGMLGARFITEQTGPLGKIAQKLLVCPVIDIADEFYLALAYDRALAAICLIASREGGIYVEKSILEPKANGETFCKIKLPPEGKLRTYHKWQVALTLQVPEKLRSTFFDLLQRLCQLFLDCDATLIEINPLVITQQNQLVALDAKMSIDDNALYRQKELASLKDPSQLAPGELEAHLAGLAYIAMEGTIGCIVNGAGLAMATLDLLEIHHLQAANFLDVGGAADLERIKKGFEILSKDPRVKVIFVHIFGGIMDCRIFIQGLLQANISPQIPLVIRMEGNRVEEAKALLKTSELRFTFASNLDEAAKLCLQLNMKASSPSRSLS